MSLYLCIFQGDREIAGVEVGGYDDFAALRRYIAAELEGGVPGSRFPVLMTHSDCDGEWPVESCGQLRQELGAIIKEMAGRPPLRFPSLWQENAAGDAGVKPASAQESFVDADGEILIARLEKLAEAAISSGRPILFQ
jgi:hypothetical protein